MPYILDIVLLLILALCVVIGVKRGFAKMLVRVVGTILALVIAALLSGQIAGGVYDAFVADTIREAALEQMPRLDVSEVQGNVDEIIASMPDYLVIVAEQQNIDIDALADQVLDAVEEQSGDVTELVVDTVVTQVVRPIGVALLTVVCFVVLAIVLLIVVWFLAGLVDKVFHLPLLGSLNKTLGGVMGALQGLFWVVIAVTVIQLIAYSGGTDDLINQAVLEKTLITGRLAEINPLTNGISELIASIVQLVNR